MISGSIVALVSPMFDDGSIDWKSMDALLDMHIREGTGAIVSVGTTGESATLSVKEHCAVIAHTVKKSQRGHTRNRRNRRQLHC